MVAHCVRDVTRQLRCQLLTWDVGMVCVWEFLHHVDYDGKMSAYCRIRYNRNCSCAICIQGWFNVVRNDILRLRRTTLSVMLVWWLHGLVLLYVLLLWFVCGYVCLVTAWWHTRRLPFRSISWQRQTHFTSSKSCEFQRCTKLYILLLM
jgi:hypothetical protein